MYRTTRRLCWKINKILVHKKFVYLKFTDQTVVINAYILFDFIITYISFSTGYAVLLVNFRGSIGQGQRGVDFLPGRVGDVDVKDCHNAAIKACEKYSYLDSENIVLYGGSHGGFLVTHLSGQYPVNMF